MRKIAMLFVMVLLLAPMAHSLIAAIGNAKVILRVEASPDNPAILDRTLKVINKNDIAVKVTLTPDEELRPFITILDKEFELAPHTDKDAAYILNIDRGGQIDGIVNVAFMPADPTVKDNTVGLASRITIISDGPQIEEPETAEEEPVSDPEVTEKSNSIVSVGSTNESQEEIAQEESEQVPTIKPVAKKGPSPMVGISIIAIVLVIGLGAFFAAMKFMRK